MITLQCWPRNLLCLHPRVPPHIHSPCRRAAVPLLSTSILEASRLLCARCCVRYLKELYLSQCLLLFEFTGSGLLFGGHLITMVHMVNSDTETHSRSGSASTPGLQPADTKADANEVPEAPLSAKSSKDSPSKSRADSKSDAGGNNKVTKRRAARACASCRARKVRCDVVEQYPCGNCRWDNVDCIVHESRRRRCEFPRPLSSLLCPQTFPRVP